MERIDKSYVINLDRRPERWEHAREELSSAGFEPTRFSAVNGSEHEDADKYDNPGALGCMLSHINIMRETREMGPVAFFEDDVVLEDGFASVFEAAWNELPEDWEALYLGGYNKTEPEAVGENLGIINHTLSTHAYIMTRKAREFVLNSFDLGQPIDVMYTRMKKERKWHITTPRIVFQRPGTSDITGNMEDYRDLHRDQ